MVHATLYLLHYNNYYNRLIKRENSLSDYLAYQLGPAIENINFIPNDFINTVQIINWNLDDPDYLIVTDEIGEIDSRWFIVSTTRTRAGQLRLELHRDLVADYYSGIVNAPMFIEKAIPKSIRDPAIYNKENMTFNQIKKGEALLYDETRCPWIVGYIPRDSFKGDEASRTIDITSQLASAADITVESLSDWEYYKYNNSIIQGAVTNPNICVRYGRYDNKDGEVFEDTIKVNKNGEFVSYTLARVTSTAGPKANKYYFRMNRSLYLSEKIAKNIVANFTSLSSSFNNLDDYVTYDIPKADIDYINSINGQTIYESSTGKYYTINLKNNEASESVFDININSSLGRQMNDTINKNPDYGSDDPAVITDNSSGTITPFYFTSESASSIFTIEPTIINIKATIPTDRYEAYETPYDIFCIPFSDELTIYKDGNVYLNKTNKAAGITLAQQIGAKVGSGNIYDIQILPYCPVRYCITSDGSFDIRSSNVTPIYTGTEIANILLWATSDNFKIKIPVTIPEKQSIIEKKVSNETEFIRIVSPNFGSSFEFSPQMNNGLDYVNVIVQMKPFNPYIKVQPNFKGMYGDNYNDARGLICGGDFSLSQISSAWANYELNNKNYQNIFDREIQNLEITQKYQRLQEGVGIATGTITGAAGGAIAGSFGGPVGAGVGAAVGAVTSLAGGIADFYINDRLRDEALNYKNDMYTYQLGNIKAIPYSLSKTSAIAPDNKFVPFIELYSSTREEKEALRNKIKYNGCTIMMIGTLNQYITNEPTYIKGKLIRTERIHEDFHVINAIADELNKGVFI